MSETDDTDDLLIIPPDFFLTSPDLDLDTTSLPYYNVVDSLITQVNKLEDRINSLQSSTDVSVKSNSLDEMYHSVSSFRKFGSTEDLPQSQKMYSESAQSTPQKPRTKFTVSSLPSSPNVDRFKAPSPRRPPKKATRDRDKKKKPDVNPMLGEIDNFLSNVKLIKRLNAVRNLEGDFSNSETYRKGAQDMDVNEINKMLKEMDLQQKQLDQRLRQNEQQVLNCQEKPFAKERAWQAGDTVDTVPDYGYGMRKNMYPEAKQPSPDEFTKASADSQDQSLYDTSNERMESGSSSESTQMTAYEKYDSLKNDVHSNAVNVLNMHKMLLDGNDGDFNLGLVSLSNLWNTKPGAQEIPSKFQQKLQEERLRRQHCEQTIKELQNRVLEFQERLAVAIQVDEAKDKAISKFHGCWEKTNSKLQELEKARGKLEAEVGSLKKKNQEDAEEAAQKISYYEREASKARNVAHTSQEKLSSMEKLYTDLQAEFKSLKTKFEDLQKKYATEVEKNRQYPEIIAEKEIEINENKAVLSEARKEVAQSKKAVEVCQNELSSLRSECNNLQARLKEDKNTITKLNEQKNKLVEEVNAHKNIEKGLQEELNRAREQLENSKVELKNFYQGQVEIVVQNKLKEFQSQLDEAERALKEEMNRKELTVAKMAASHIHQLSEKHSLEVKLVEEKHQEECRLYQLQLSQLHQELGEASAKLKRHHDKHNHIERQLHKFMESLRQDHVTTLDEMNSFRSKSFTNLEELLSWRTQDEEKNNKKDNKGQDDSLLTYRVPVETPVTSKEDKGARRREHTLQETIQMLLDRNNQANESGKEGFMPLYNRLMKENKGKPPWK